MNKRLPIDPGKVAEVRLARQLSQEARGEGRYRVTLKWWAGGGEHTLYAKSGSEATAIAHSRWQHGIKSITYVDAGEVI